MAIQANELRIGSWVSFAPKGTKRFQPVPRNCVVEKVSGYTIVISDKGQPIPLFPHDVELQPVPITPEILEKAGFENDNGEFQHPNNTDFDLMFCQSGNGLWCAYNFGWDKEGPLPDKIPKPVVANPICNPFKYLHQLQNLYFALTGQELEIKL